MNPLALFTISSAMHDELAQYGSRLLDSFALNWPLETCEAIIQLREYYDTSYPQPNL